MTLQFLVYAFLVSLLLLPYVYSSDSSHLFSSSNFRFSASLSPLLTQSPERKYMFLVCIGLVVFLTKNLSLSGSGNANDNEDGVSAVGETEAPIEENESTIEGTMGGPAKINVVSIEKQENGCMEIKVRGRAAQATIVEETEDGDDGVVEESDGSRSLIPTSSSVGDEEQNDEVSISTEELNRKFDEFIRKTKEEMRIDAQRQLLVSV